MAKQFKSDIKYSITLDDEQKNVKKSIFENQIVIVTGRAGCLSYGTKVLMHDGSYREVQDIKIGDKLMGIDSEPRTVQELFSGKQQMYWVKQNKGNDYRVNEDHILSLIQVKSSIFPRKTMEGKRVFDYSKEPNHVKTEEIINISLKDYLSLPKRVIKQLKGYISDTIFFKEQPLKIDPYYLGLWLGDGNRRSIRSISSSDREILEYLFSLKGEHSKTHKYEILMPKGFYNNEFKEIYNLKTVDSLDEKYIPKEYILNSVENRLQILAGILDSDGHYNTIGKYYDLVLKDKKLMEDVTYICRSLGFKTNFRTRLSKMKRKDGSMYECVTYRLSIILTNDLIIPTKIERKKHSKNSKFKNRRHTGIKIVKDIVDNYYGFMLDGDNLFILDDFTVTHNSGKSLVCAQTALDLFFKKEVEKILVTRANVETGRSLGFLPGTLDEKFNPYLEAFKENLMTSYSDTKEKKEKLEQHIKNKDIDALPIAFIRGKTINDILIVEESQNLLVSDVSSIVSRLGKNGRIVFNGDFDQVDTKESYTGLHYLMDMANALEDIKVHKLKHNHRSDLVGKILDWEYSRNKKV